MKFIADRMLGKLAKGLRILGYDTVYTKGEDTYSLIKWAREENRVILTRNTKLIPKRPEDRILRIVEDRLPLQMKELIQKKVIDLNEEDLFSRCLLCNILLEEISTEEAEGKVPDYIYYQQKKFSRCPQCRRIYWEGSHQNHMRKRMVDLWKNTK